MERSAKLSRRLQAKHSVRRVEIDQPVEQEIELVLLEEVILLQALWNAPREAQPGVDGWRFEHIWDALRTTTSMDPMATRLASSMTELVNSARQGRLPEWLYGKLAGANLSVLQKRHYDVRPIAMGSILQSLVSRSLALQHRESMEAYFSPLQLGVGTKQGAETIVHAVKLAIDEHLEWVLFQTDFKNAYNSVTRSKALEAARSDDASVDVEDLRSQVTTLDRWSWGAGAYLQRRRRAARRSTGTVPVLCGDAADVAASE